MNAKRATLQKGAFVLSLDTELAWGCCGDPKRLAKHRNDFLATRENIMRLLSLMEEYRISATWAVVGHLFLSRCQPVNGVKHPEIVRPDGVLGDWFATDPCSDITADPSWYGQDIIQAIRQCRVPQEIGCHTFSHVVADSPDCNREWFDSELEMCQAIAGQLGLQLKSLTYPRNREAFLDVLVQNGVIAYRGKEPRWYAHLPRMFEKMAYLADSLLYNVPPPLSLPEKERCWNIKGSWFYGHYNGLAGLIPASFRIAKINRGIDEAAKQKSIMHLWFHPFNLASNPRAQLAGLRSIFAHVDKMRQEGKLENLTMGALAGLLESNRG